MNFGWLTDAAFFIATLGSITLGGSWTVRKMYYEFEKESLTTVQKGLYKMEPFAKKLTRK